MAIYKAQIRNIASRVLANLDIEVADEPITEDVVKPVVPEEDELDPESLRSFEEKYSELITTPEDLEQFNKSLMDIAVKEGLSVESDLVQIAKFANHIRVSKGLQPL